MTEQTEDWVPAFPSQRPPFAPGNTLAMSHGGYSQRMVVGEAKAVMAALLPDLPDYLLQPRYRPALDAYATCLARISRVAVWLERLGTEDQPAELTNEGGVRAATTLLMQLEREADRHRSALGLTPLAAARLGKDVAAAQRTIWDAWGEPDGPLSGSAAAGEGK